MILLQYREFREWQEFPEHYPQKARRLVTRLRYRLHYLSVKVQDAPRGKLMHEKSEAAAIEWALQIIDEHIQCQCSKNIAESE